MRLQLDALTTDVALEKHTIVWLQILIRASPLNQLRKSDGGEFYEDISSGHVPYHQLEDRKCTLESEQGYSTLLSQIYSKENNSRTDTLKQATDVQSKFYYEIERFQTILPLFCKPRLFFTDVECLCNCWEYLASQLQQMKRAKGEKRLNVSIVYEGWPSCQV